MKKQKSILIAIALLSVITFSCKKEKEPEPAPATPSPTATTVTVNISLIDVGATSIVNPKMIGVKVSPTGVMSDTIFNTTITNWALLTAFPTTDADCNNVYSSFPSGSITYTGVDDGSYIRIYFYDGTTWKHACRAYYGDGNISSNSSAGGVTEHYVYSPPLITLAW